MKTSLNLKDISDKILVSREQKSVKIQKLKMRFKTVITLKTNTPGKEKQLNVSYLLVGFFYRLIPTGLIAYSEYNDGYDGPYYLLGSERDARDVKRQLMVLEETHPLGRFIDFDVFDEGNSLSRGFMRKCFICERDAFVCARENNHSTQELIENMSNQSKSYFRQLVIKKLDESIEMELELDPKFGLVTPVTQGSHKDMDAALMRNAKDSILPFFEQMFDQGWEQDDIRLIFKSIRNIGLKAEEDMFKTTHGVNAYKGLIFNMGLIVSALAYVMNHHLPFQHLFGIIKEMTKPLEEDFVKEYNSFGMNAYKSYGFKGARGEAMNGFITVVHALEHLEDFTKESLLHTLIYLIAYSEDTVLLKRAGSLEMYREVKSMFVKSIYTGFADIDDLNTYCLKNRLSFGGSADLLVATIFIKKTSELY